MSVTVPYRRRLRPRFFVWLGLLCVFVLGPAWAQKIDPAATQTSGGPSIPLPAPGTPGLAGGIFEIDGELQSGLPADDAVGVGLDWLDGPAGSGVLGGDVLGTPKDPQFTYHGIDLYNVADATLFKTGSNKVSDNPTTYNVVPQGSLPSKDDINHGLVHFFFQDTPQGPHLWAAVAGDRESEKGDSYIDFEFLQSALTLDLGTGTFTSAGPDGGRTVNDILLTLHLLQGGAQVEFFSQTWQEASPGVFSYVDAPLPPGVYNAFANLTADVPTTYEAFGGFTYPTNTFGEASLDLTGLGITNECTTISTVFIRTKSSASPTAELKDLIVPIQVHVCIDNQPPVLTCPSNRTFECDETVVFGDATATDNCDSDVDITYSDETAGTCPTVITRTWRAEDDCENVSTCVQTVTIDDTKAPVVTSCPDDYAIQCGNPVFGHPTFTDNCDPSLTLDSTTVTSPGTCPKVVTRTWWATDDCGNESAHCDQAVTIDDTTAPVVTSCPEDHAIQCGNPVFGHPTFTDNCDADLTIDSTTVASPGSCPKVVTRTWWATDDCGNESAHCDQAVTIDDTTAPVVTSCPDDATAECGQPTFGHPTFTDNCDADLTIDSTTVTSPGSCPKVITRTWWATDNCGNESAHCDQAVTIDDNVAPAVTSCPDDATIQCGEPVFGHPTFTDNCDLSLTLDSTTVTSPGTCPRVVTRTWWATDDCGNESAHCDQAVTIDDTTAPVVSSCPEDATIACDQPIVFGRPAFTDNCDLSLTLDSTTVESPDPCPKVTTRTWWATDDCGNESAHCDQAITVECCPQQICTLTQGAYGSAGGKFNGMGTLELIQSLLELDPLVVGKGGRSLTIAEDAAQCIIDRLPGGTTPSALPVGFGDQTLNPSTCQTNPPLPLYDSDRWSNVFLAQVVTLSLNTRLDPNLPAFELSATFCTTAGEFQIYSKVLTALSNHGLPQTVAGLLELANRALAGQATNPATIAQINDAIDTINRAFDECRSVVPCGLTAATSRTGEDGGPQLSTGDVGLSFETPAPLNTPTRFELGQNYPNPFNPNTRIKLSVPQAARWTLSIYNVAGQLVKRFEGSTSGPEFVDVQWDGTNRNGESVSTGVYIYRMDAGPFTAMKKMVLLK